MSSIMEQIKPEHPELFALEFGKNAETDFVYTLASPNINQILTRGPRGSVVRCLTRNPGVLGSSRTRSSMFFRGSVLGQDTSEPSLVQVKPRKA